MSIEHVGSTAIPDLGEIGMIFNIMQSFKNLTAITDGVDENGTSYCLHQIGLLYLIDGLAHSKLQNAEMEHAWIDTRQLESEAISPCVYQILKLFLINGII